MKKLLTCTIGLLFLLPAFASHIIGGEIGYQFVRVEPGTPNKYVYLVTLKLYRNCNSPAALPGTGVVRVHDASNNQLVLQDVLQRTSLQLLPTTTTASCTVVPVSTCYEIGIYSKEITLNGNVNGYILSHNVCCRVAGLSNVLVTNSTGSTYTTNIPGQLNPVNEFNSTPVSGDSVKVICKSYNSAFRLNFTDPDGDSLSYSFCDSYLNSPDPPFSPLTYQNNYSGSNPLGNSNFVIDPATGVISGSSATNGEYAVTVCVTEHRNNVPINVYRKEFQFRIDSCSITSLLPPLFQNCNDLSVTFNHSNDPLLKYKWNFGDTLTNNDTSNVVTPTYTYNRADSFFVKMVVTRGTECIDSSTSKVRVFPGFFTNFQLPPSPHCSFSNLVFKDSTKANYGLVNQWAWTVEFPAGSATPASSTQDLSYNFPWPSGNTNLSEQAKIQLISYSSVGCADTAEKVLTIDRAPTLNAGPDLLLCKGDSITIPAQSDGFTFTWSPSTALSNSAVLNPKAAPLATSTYQVTSNFNGCISTDDVIIKVGDAPIVSAGADIIKCYEDTVQLSASANGVFNFTWSPAASLSDAGSANPFAFPTQTTAYIVSIADTGSCRKTISDTMILRVVQKIDLNAGKDTFVRRGNPIQLRVRGAQLYAWEPANLLVNPTSPNPVAVHLTQDAQFTVRGYTPEGCEDFDTVNVKILDIDPDIFVPTAFTPNNDGRNDLLKPIGLGAEYLELFIVYNRWGKEVFFTREYGKGWDGTINGKPQPTGTYAWYIQARDYLGKKIVKQGTSVLMR